MESADFILDSAHVQHDEFVGTAAAEKDVTVHADDLYETVGLDRKRWSILAINMYEGTGSRERMLKVYAINRQKYGLDGVSYEKMMALGAVRGSLPVTEFKVHGVDPRMLADKVFKRYKVQLRAASLHDMPLHVEALDDLNLDE